MVSSAVSRDDAQPAHHRDEASSPPAAAWVTSTAGFLELEEGWRALARRSPGATVFQSWEWNQAWWRKFGRGRELFTPVIRAEALAGIAPLTRRRLGPVRLVEFLGAGRTDYLRFIAGDEAPPVLTHLLAALRARASQWDVLWLRDMPLEEDEAAAFNQTVRAAGLGGSVRKWDVAPYLDLSGTWEEYLAGRSSNFRSDLKRKRKKLEQAGPVTIERLRDPGAVREGLAAAADIERHSWKFEAGTARMAEQAGLEFFQDAASALAEDGKTELWLLRCGDKPAAFYLNFISGDSVCYYSGTYRGEYHEMSPGKVLMADVIRTAFEEGYRRFDFLRGAEAYKSTWTGDSRPLYEAFIHSPRLPSRAAAWLLGDLLLPSKRHPKGQALVARWQRLRGRLRG